jgi:elongation factor 3
MAFTDIIKASSTDDRKEAAVELAKEANLVDFDFKALEELLTGDGVAKEGGLMIYEALAKKQKGAASPFIYKQMTNIINLSADKKSKEVREAAESAAKAIAKQFSPNAIPMIFSEILDIAKNSSKAQVKILALSCLGQFVGNGPDQVAERMVEIVPVVSDLMWDSNKKVQKAATKALKKLCSAIDNKDVEPFIPTLISAISTPKEVEECVHNLAATTFVQTVTAAALSITVPLLDRGFKERKIATIRKCAVITENMAKLVENPADVAPFMPVLEPHLARAKNEVADPECRTRCAAAHQELLNISNRAEKAQVEEADFDKVVEGLVMVFEKADMNLEDEKLKEVKEYAGKVVQYLSVRIDADEEDWKEDLLPLLRIFKGKSVEDEIVGNIAVNLKELFKGSAQEEVMEEDELDAEKLCDCRFSLAYGSRILLNNARLYLKRGMRYGIVAAKSAGKTTLLRSISNGQLEGFPVDTLKTVFVEHDIQASQARMNVVEFTLDTVGDEGVSEDDVKTILTDVGFTDAMQTGPITALSGGWKMKLALARAMLRKADILLLDEPTNHLDVVNVQWVVDYLIGKPCSNVTSLIVSHDTKFLDKVATHIIHFDALKLNNYVGNLSKFVERFPHAKAYYDLTASALKFKFPLPGPLDGVKSKGRAILSMTDVEFAYPGQEKPQLANVNIRVSMASRVACVGANGAGKSTMIKLLTGELKPNKGTVYKHPNCNFAYVAQHAFHHIEQHLSKTPTEYIMWRYSGGEDKEALMKSTVKITDEELKKMKTPVLVQYEDEEGKKIKEKRVVERLIGRRKQGKIYEYEVKWVGKSQDMNMWYPRQDLEDLGFKKLLDEVDRRKAAQENAFARVLSKANVEQHFENVGLDRELASHNRISALSGGQKVKVVLAACTWSQPHLIILDEPTNYLDREALGALAGAINDFGGGVVLITHNQEFADATTRETWVVANNTCDIKGDADWTAYAAEAIELDLNYKEERVDALGNKIQQKRTPASLKPKEKKTMMKDLKKRLKADPECVLSEFEEECATAWGLFA